MLTSPETNVKFTDEQKTQLEEYKSRLTNIESEISIGQKALRSIRLETEQAIKDTKFYQKEIIQLTSQVQSINSELSILNTHKTNLEKEIKEQTEYSQSVYESHGKKIRELSERENVVTNKEKEHTTKVADFTTQLAELENKKLSIQKGNEILKNVIVSLSLLN